jgi:outer membrane protein assembly factor BamC
MKKIIVLLISIIALSGCFSDIKDSIKERTKVGKQDIRYYADKTVNNLEVPPDLTRPSQKNALKLNTFIDDDKNLTTFDDEEVKIINSIKNKNIDIEVQRSGTNRWLIVKKDANFVWNAATDFLKDSGFRILKSNKSIGIMETNYLENKVDIPNQNLGLIRSMFKKAFQASYALPTLDKYRVRLEKIDATTTEVYLSIHSMREVTTNKGEKNENTIWQEKETDKAMEVEMLYRLMVYLGSDNNIAKAKIEKATDSNNIVVKIASGLGGFAKLQFNQNKDKTWDSVAWALDKLNIEIDDRDKADYSVYLNIANEEERGIISRIFGDDAIKQNVRMKIKQISPQLSEVYFIDIAGENNEESKQFSKNLFAKIQQQF